jgi:hypothetical protein
MQKLPAFSILFVVIFISALFLRTSFLSQAQTTSQQELCRQDPQGTWMEFSNGCGDSCDFVRNPKTTNCTQAFTYACNCDPDSCWNGTKCEPIDIKFSKADLNKDGKVDTNDYEFMKTRFFKTDPDSLKADISADGKVDIRDYAILVIEWTR